MWSTPNAWPASSSTLLCADGAAATWASPYSWNNPDMLLLQGFCTGLSLCLECSSPNQPVSSCRNSNTSAPLFPTHPQNPSFSYHVLFSDSRLLSSNSIQLAALVTYHYCLSPSTKKYVPSRQWFLTYLVLFCSLYLEECLAHIQEVNEWIMAYCRKCYNEVMCMYYTWSACRAKGSLPSYQGFHLTFQNTDSDSNLIQWRLMDSFIVYKLCTESLYRGWIQMHK